jgi:hypothetical protein
MSNRDFRKTRWIGALVLASVFVLLSLGIGPTAEIPSSQPRTAGIVVGRDTTYLLGPLRADGTVDYIAAVNAEYSQGVTPENNAACLLVRVNPPEPSHDEDTPLAKQPELLRLLGFTGSVPEAIPWHNLKEFDPKFAGIGFIYPTSGYSLAMTGPWAAADMPAGKQWLDANKPALDLAVEASQRERYWMPVVSADGTGLLLTVAQPNSSRWRALTGSLQARAMLELQQGDRDVAWNDLWAVYRLASFLAHSTDEIDVLLSPIVERNAWIADRALMIDPNTSMDLLHRMSADMSVFVRAPRIRELGERESTDSNTCRWLRKWRRLGTSNWTR